MYRHVLTTEAHFSWSFACSGAASSLHVTKSGCPALVSCSLLHIDAAAHVHVFGGPAESHMSKSW